MERGSVKLTGKNDGDLAVFECEKDYLLTGAILRECLADGSWSGKLPVCKSKFSFIYLIPKNTAYLLQNSAISGYFGIVYMEFYIKREILDCWIHRNNTLSLVMAHIYAH